MEFLLRSYKQLVWPWEGVAEGVRGMVWGTEHHENPARAPVLWNEPDFQFPGLSEGGLQPCFQPPSLSSFNKHSLRGRLGGLVG